MIVVGCRRQNVRRFFIRPPFWGSLALGELERGPAKRPTPLPPDSVTDYTPDLIGGVSFLVGSARPRFGHGAVYHFKNFLDTPNVIRNASLHGRCDPQRLVNPGKILVHKVDCDSRHMVFHFLAESVC